MKRMILAGLSAVMMAMSFPAMAMVEMVSHDMGATHVEGYGGDVGLAPMFVQMDTVDTLKTDMINAALADADTLGDVPILTGLTVERSMNIGNAATTGHFDTGDGISGYTYLRTSAIGWPAFGYAPAFAPVV